MNVIRKTAIAALTLITVLLAVPAVNASPLPGAGLAATTVVNVEEPNFDPAKVVIHVGDKVRWVNTDTIDHTTTSDAGLWDETLSPGESFTRKFNVPGKFTYHCDIFPDMTGVVIVKR